MIRGPSSMLGVHISDQGYDLGQILDTPMEAMSLRGFVIKKHFCYFHFLFVFVSDTPSIAKKKARNYTNLNVQSGLHQNPALQSSGGLQLAPTVLIFRIFRRFKVQFFGPKFPIKNGKIMKIFEPRCVKWHVSKVCTSTR